MATAHEEHARKAGAERDHREGKPALDGEEERRVSDEQKLDAALTHEVIRREAVRELNRSPLALAWSGGAAGLAMGLSPLAMAALRHGLPDAPWRPLVAGLGYSVGFLVVTLGSQQLYTENTLRPVVPFMAHRTRRMLRKVLVLWGVVLLANLLGAFAFAWAAARTVVLPSELQEAIRNVALEGTSRDWLGVFASGIAAGWLIALMVWMLPAASNAQMAVIVLMTWLVAVAKLSHVVVGSVESFYLVALGERAAGAALGGYVLPALLGNTLGGVTLVAALNHAQVKS